MVGYNYFQMRSLIVDAYPLMRDVKICTPEILTAIFWEETGFRNIQQDGGPAVGFGQIEPNTIILTNLYFKTHHKPSEILASPYTAIIVANLTLVMFYHKLGSRSAALDAYAGVRHRPENVPIPGRWQDCERQLLKIHAAEAVTDENSRYGLTLKSDDIDGLKAALKTAKPNSVPNMAFQTADAAGW